MSKRISPEQHVIAFFMTASPSACQTMFETIKAMARIRGQEAAVADAKPTPRKRSRVTKAPRPPGALSHATATPATSEAAS